jgi:hypothetical protein
MARATPLPIEEPFVYDLNRLEEHPLMLDLLLPSTIALFGGGQSGEFLVDLRWKGRPHSRSHQGTILIRWDCSSLRGRLPEIEAQVENLLTRDLDRRTWIENAAVIVSVAVMARIAPTARYTYRSAVGTGHDYYLSDDRREMIEVAGRGSSKRGIDDLFRMKAKQSSRNPRLRNRWVSVTIFSTRARNKTERVNA